MQTHQIQIPEQVGLTTEDVQFLLFAQLYHLEKLSSGQAAEALQIPRSSFLEQLTAWEIPMFIYNEEDFKDETNAIENFLS